MRLLVFCLAVMLMFSGVRLTHAEDESASVYFQREFQLQQRMRNLVQKPTHLIRRAKPVRGFTLEDPLASPLDPWGETNTAIPSPAPSSSPSSAPLAPKEAQDDGSAKVLHIAVIGDHLAQDVAHGLSDTFAERHDVALMRFINANARLGRDEGGDAGTLLHDVLTAPTPVDVAIIMLGVNDVMSLRESASAQANEAEWAGQLSARAALLVRQLRAHKIDVIWVGLPIVKSERLAADIDIFNGRVHDQLTAADAVFVDVWDGFQDDRGLYAAYGPDINGQFQKMRMADGVHFTAAGARTLAYFVEGDLRNIVDARRGVEPVVPLQAIIPATTEVGAVDNHINSPAPASAAMRESFGVLIPLPPPVTEMNFAVHSPAGPIMPLTQRVSATAGQLIAPREERLRNGQSASSREADRLLDQVFGEGRAPLPRHGRSDDFSWPPQAR